MLGSYLQYIFCCLTIYSVLINCILNRRCLTLFCLHFYRYPIVIALFKMRLKSPLGSKGLNQCNEQGTSLISSLRWILSGYKQKGSDSDRILFTIIELGPHHGFCKLDDRPFKFHGSIKDRRWNTFPIKLHYQFLYRLIPLNVFPVKMNNQLINVCI